MSTSAHPATTHPTADDDDGTSTIRSLFDEASALIRQLDSYASTSAPEYQSTLSSALQKLQKCKALVNAASLFSMNESLEDLASNDIRYLTLDYHLATLASRITHSVPTVGFRTGNLTRARDHYQTFATLASAYGLVPASEKSALERIMASGAPGSSLPSDPAARRTAKIAQFRREKELKEKLMLLEKVNSGDEDDVRALHVATVELCAMQTIPALEGIALEMDMLARAPSAPEPGAEQQREEDERRRERERGRREDGYSERVDDLSAAPGIRGGALLNKEGKPLRPFVLLDKRQQVRDGVFRPGHTLPTMTIDEYLEEEKRRGGIIEGGGEKSGERPLVDEDDYEVADRETMKAREWDEFTEANPKGAGNTLNRG